jgi:hypothetical protein
MPLLDSHDSPLGHFDRRRCATTQALQKFNIPAMQRMLQ